MVILLMMKRHVYQPRPDWREKVESVGLTFHSHDNGPYWDESACYELTRAEVDELELAANKLHFLCIDAAEAVIKNNWWARLQIPEAAVPCILRSWERDDFSLYGRFDFAYDGVTPPKLLEYNADTPDRAGRGRRRAMVLAAGNPSARRPIQFHPRTAHRGLAALGGKDHSLQLRQGTWPRTK